MHYVYHPYHEPVIVTPEEYPMYLENGWYDSPAKFPKEQKNEPDAEPVEAQPKKKGRPPKQPKQEEVNASVEL